MTMPGILKEAKVTAEVSLDEKIASAEEALENAKTKFWNSTTVVEELEEKLEELFKEKAYAEWDEYYVEKSITDYGSSYQHIFNEEMFEKVRNTPWSMLLDEEIDFYMEHLGKKVRFDVFVENQYICANRVDSATVTSRLFTEPDECFPGRDNNLP